MRTRTLEIPYASEHTSEHSFALLACTTIRSDNSSGAKGVYRRGDKYAAKVTVAGNQIQLGIYSSFSAACKARKSFDRAIERTVTPAYNRWFRKAEKSPAWARENPFRITITHQRGKPPAISCDTL